MNNKIIKLPAIPYWLKWVFALVPIVWIFWTINIHGMLRAAASLPWWGVPLVVVNVLASMFIQGVRWWLLLKAFIPAISFWKVMNAHFAGIFYSIALPTSAAGDVVRTFLISQENDYAVAWSATWLSRITGLVVLLLFSVIGLLLMDRSKLPESVSLTILMVFALLVVCVFLSFSKKVTRPVRKALHRVIPHIKPLEIMENIRNGIYQYRYKKMNLVIVLSITVLVQFLLVGYTCLIIKGIAGKFYLLECMTFVPMIEIVCMSVPLTPSGLGVREALSKLMFDHIGLLGEQLGVYIVLSFLATSLKLVGALPILFGLVKRPKAAKQ